MTVSQIETVLGKAIQDPATATGLQTDPEGTLKGLGYAPHPEEVDFFKKLGSGGFGTAASDLNSKDPQHYSSEC
jgi:hypothetical protein